MVDVLLVDDEEIDLVVSGEDTTMPCSSPDVSETLAAPPDFRDQHHVATSPVLTSTSSIYDCSDYQQHVKHDVDDVDDHDEDFHCRLQLLNDVSFCCLYCEYCSETAPKLLRNCSEIALKLH